MPARFLSGSCIRRLAALSLAWLGVFAAVPSNAQTAAENRQAGAGAAVERAHASTQAPNLAFYDADQPPLDELQAFDAIVLDPASGFDPSTHPLAHSIYIARAAASANTAPADFVANRIEPLWQRGFRGFLLDSPAGFASIDSIVAAHPDAKIIVAGDTATAYSVAEAHRNAIYAVVIDSLVEARNDSATHVVDVPAAEREQRVAAAQAFMQRTRVPVVSIEYCESAARACARTLAAQVAATGVEPYVTDPARDLVGIGRIEVMPRKVLVIQDRDPNEPIDLSLGVRALATPLNYLGYDVEYADFSHPLPAHVTPDRYAGVVAWIQRNAVPDPLAWRRWIGARMADQLPVAFLGQFGFNVADNDSAIGLHTVSGILNAPLTVAKRDPMVGFEIMPRPDPRDLPNIQVGADGQSLLRIASADKAVDVVGLTRWGGFALNQYTVVSLDGIEQERWAIQPIAFLRAALRLPDLPAPNVTTENGRRLFMTHVDGDGFASRSEFPGPDYSGEALYEQIFTRYSVPMTLSVIEGEVGPTGLYPKISPRLEEIARKIFALPYVEIGTHTYSHPFNWEEVDAKTGLQKDRGGGDSAFSLNIPGYKFNLDREISGSIHYIDTRLAPAGKRTVVLQWSGDCMPPAVVVKKTYEAGVLNVNGGDTVITHAADSWTNIAPIGVDKGPGAYQIYAPNQDENVYTSDWQGPFYGFTRVLETFDMTDHPLRFKPIDVYYHMYSGTKVASLRALTQIFDTVLAQPVLPVHVTDYLRKVLDWRSFAVAREGDAWLVRGNGEVRELHWPKDDVPLIDAAHDSTGVTGYSHGPDGTYIHIDGGAARFTLGAKAAPGALPYIAQANGFVRNFQRSASGLRFEFGGYYKPFVELASASTCRVSMNGARVAATRNGTLLRVDIPGVAGQQVTYRPLEIDCGR
ncbi:sugar ABC transporter [Trinickia sp. YCB016]